MSSCILDKYYDDSNSSSSSRITNSLGNLSERICSAESKSPDNFTSAQCFPTPRTGIMSTRIALTTASKIALAQCANSHISFPKIIPIRRRFSVKASLPVSPKSRDHKAMTPIKFSNKNRKSSKIGIPSKITDSSIKKNLNKSILRSGLPDLMESFNTTYKRKWVINQKNKPLKFHEKFTILLANNSHNEIDITINMLRMTESDIMVLTASDGKEAYQIFNKKFSENLKFHLIILEMNMPNYNGLGKFLVSFI